jgi:hypothetical protein
VDSNYYPGHDGLIKFTVDSTFGLHLLSKNSGFMILFFEDNRRAPFLYTQINLQEGSPFYIFQYSFMGQQPNPNALLQAFELQQKTGYDIREGSAQLCRSAQDWTGYPLSNGDMNYEPTGTPGGVMEVIHWGSRDVPIPTPGLKILSAARLDDIPALKGTLTRTTCITCQACGLSHTRQKANQPRRNAPPQCIAATNSSTEFPFSCHSCKVSFLSNEAFATHTRGVHKITTAFLTIQTVAREVGNNAQETEKSPVQDRSTKAETYRQASTNSDVQKLSADARKAITEHKRPGELETIAEDLAGDPAQNPAAKPPPKLSSKERSIIIAQGKKPIKEKQPPSKEPSLEPGELTDLASSSGTAPPPPPSTKTTEVAQDKTEITERSIVLATRPLPAWWGKGAPPDADMADKEERPAAETEVTPKKQKITKSKKIMGAQSA